MFVASLNLDLFFKKVFSNKRIAKHFLQDLLGVKIKEFEFLKIENKVTDGSVTVKFDFRCKINSQYVVIEMQQKYKIDVIKRFYLTHSISTTLQLETLKPIKVTKPNGETYMEKNYSGLEPVITLIWMVDDTLGFKEDYVAFTTLPESAKEFIVNDELWQQPLDVILAEREKTLHILDNKTKGLDFFTKNRLIYAFQKNIVKNKRVTLPYFKWFDLANKSKNPFNIEEDFSNFKNDKVMAEVISRIRRDKLPEVEFNYVSDLMSYEILMARRDQDHSVVVDRFENKLKKADKKIEMAEKKIEMVEKEKEMAEKEKEKANQNQIKLVKLLLKQGATIETIASTLDMGIELTKEYIERLLSK
jgi:hypothetical protein